MRSKASRISVVLMAMMAIVSLVPLHALAAEPDAEKIGGYEPRGRRDPFVPLIRDGRKVDVTGTSGPRDTSKPTLYGILWDPGGQSIALINSGEAKVGDTIDGYKVTAIRKDAVVLMNGEESVVLQIVFESPSKELSPGTTTGGEDR